MPRSVERTEVAIAKRIQEAIQKAHVGDHEGALIPACVAVDATARLEHPSERSNAARYKAFLRDYAWVIGLVGLRGVIARRIQVNSLHPDLKPDPDGTVALEEVLYGVIRCGLVHEASIENYVVLSPTVTLGYHEGKYQVAESLPLGLVAAAILSPANSSERIGDTVSIQIGRRTFPVDELWGQKEMVSRELASGRL